MPTERDLAILSVACRFPDANSPAELWKNVLDGRRSFRSIPSQRIDIARYAASVIGEMDSITPIRAGLLCDWRVRRDSFRISKTTFATTDLTHWLALELAAEAIESAGGTSTIDKDRTAVVVANTLAGEFSRSSLVRLRTPFLEEMLSKAGRQTGLETDSISRLCSSFVAEIRKRLPDPNEDSLAGGLANTIAGRIANYFDLRGGAFSVDGACASSLVALADAGNLLSMEQVDTIVLVAVDLSIDPFELVGFSRNGALSPTEMRVFDARSDGFWPGEGGAAMLISRESYARRRGIHFFSRIRGWGISSDGAGALTRPTTDGQLRAYRQAYEMANIDPNDLGFVEAHGTGTAVGDPIEVRALAALRTQTSAALSVGSIKANIGHTKAAAGLAGLVKALEALRHGIIPPHVGCEQPHPVFEETGQHVQPSFAPRMLGENEPLIAGVSSFGFGGINTHVVVEGISQSRAARISPKSPISQDCELLLFSGDHLEDVMALVDTIERRAHLLSTSELSDAAAYLSGKNRWGPIRAAVVASRGCNLPEQLAQVRSALQRGTDLADSRQGVFVGRPQASPRIGFLFPGQAAPSRADGGVWTRRFAHLRPLIEALPRAGARDPVDTDIAQPCIVAASIAAAALLSDLAMPASIAVGHSLGEISALAWSGAFSYAEAVTMATKRGAIMAQYGTPGGTMLRVALNVVDASHLAEDTQMVVACRNGPNESVLAGTVEAVRLAAALCEARGVEASPLAVSHAFHTPHMQSSADELKRYLATFPFAPAAKPVVSTVTGDLIPAGTDLRAVLTAQLVQPVLFDLAMQRVCSLTDILIEVGPGSGLSRLAQSYDRPCYSVDAFGESISPLLQALAAACVAGASINADALFDGRAIRPFSPNEIPQFLDNPCGSRVAIPVVTSVEALPIAKPAADVQVGQCDPTSAVVVAILNETGLQQSQFSLDDRFLDSLRLSSLAVTRIVVDASRRAGIRVPAAPAEFSNATPRQLADALCELQKLGSSGPASSRIAGVRPWTRTYEMRFVTSKGRPPSPKSPEWYPVTVGSSTVPSASLAGCEALSVHLGGRLANAEAEELVEIASEAARCGVRHLALLHSGAPVGAFARSIAKEGHFLSVRVIDYGDFDTADARVLTAMNADADGYYEIRLGERDSVAEPEFAPARASETSQGLIGQHDVAVVVGGGKGIASECALRLARHGAAVVLVGRSSPDNMAVVETLARAEELGARCLYVVADVNDFSTLEAALKPALHAFGPVTALVFAPAINQPSLLTDLDRVVVREALLPKTTGLENALNALGSSLRCLVTFGSIIGRIGLEGEAHYALANAMQTMIAEQWGAGGEGRRALSIEWSVWGGIGMGERLGTIERLTNRGVDAISVDDALEAFERLLASGATGAVVVTSRFGSPPNLSLGPLGLPMLRFLDDPKVHFPRVELVCETTLSYGRDLYLEDHELDGQGVLPAVLGLEAMAQAVSALSPFKELTRISDVRLNRAIHVRNVGSRRVRIATLGTEGRIEAQLLAEDDGFAEPCMSASFAHSGRMPDLLSLPSPPDECFPAEPLYGPLFFQGPRFQRVDRFRVATSRLVVAQLRTGGIPDGWFSSFEAPEFVLWEPGVADAALHALQVAVPHKKLLPVSVESIDIDTTVGGLTTVFAIEKHASADNYTFDLEVSDSAGRIGQRWTNVTFHSIGHADIARILEASASLTQPYLERLARESLGDDSISVSFVCDAEQSRASRRNLAIKLLELNTKVHRRVDGRLTRVDGKGLSISHSSDTTLAIASDYHVGCDIERFEPDDRKGIPELIRHTASEAVRKLGRRTPSAPLPSSFSHVASIIDGIAILSITLPQNHAVSLCRLENRQGRSYT